MGVKYDVVAVTGEYEDRDGNTKKRYVNMGKVITTKSGGYMLIIDAIPTKWDGMAYLNDPKPRDGQQGQQRSVPRQQSRTQASQGQAPAGDDFEDDVIPF